MYATGLAGPFKPATTATIAATTTAAAASIGTFGGSVLIENTADNHAFVQFGVDNTVTATSADFVVPGGTSRLLSVPDGAAYISAILSTGTGTIYVSRGQGVRLQPEQLPANTLYLDFLGSTMPSGMTFTRASSGTYFDATGTMQTVATNVPRLDYDPVTLQPRGLLIEGQRTNLLLNSASLSTQSVTTSATAYTLSFYGTGSVALSGAYTGTLAGTGAYPTRVNLSFTAAAGTLTLTVTGTVQYAQLEAGSFLTSYIPTTAAAATRASEFCSMPVGSWLNTNNGTLACEALIPSGLSSNGWSACLSDGTANNLAGLFQQANGTASALVIAGGTTEFAPFLTSGYTFGAVQKSALAWSPGPASWAFNGTVRSTGSAPTIPGVSTLFLGLRDSTYGGFLNGYVRRVQYWPRRLRNAELQAATT